MALITSVRTKVKEDNSTLAIIKAEGIETTIFLTSKQIKSACGLANNFSILKGADIEVEFYKKGDKLVSGAEVTDDNKIVKEYSIELPAHLVKVQSLAAFGVAVTL